MKVAAQGRAGAAPAAERRLVPVRRAGAAPAAERLVPVRRAGAAP